MGFNSGLKGLNTITVKININRKENNCEDEK
jgi:hypothetical protein